MESQDALTPLAFEEKLQREEMLARLKLKLRR
jgi:hypothetical protein